MTLPKFLIVMVYSKLLLSRLNAFDEIEVQLEYQIVPDHDADPAVGSTRRVPRRVRRYSGM